MKVRFNNKKVKAETSNGNFRASRAHGPVAEPNGSSQIHFKWALASS